MKGSRLLWGAISIYFSIIFMASPLYASDDKTMWVHKTFLNGEKFINLSERDQAYYTMGVIDGILASPIYGAKEPEIKWFNDCLVGKTNTQITAILRKYIKDNAGEWHQYASILLHNALNEICPHSK